jgi:hypothetical protein
MLHIIDDDEVEEVYDEVLLVITPDELDANEL